MFLLRLLQVLVILKHLKDLKTFCGKIGTKIAIKKFIFWTIADITFTDLKSETSQMVGDDEFDEFGFKIDVEDGPEQSSSKLLSTPFQDNPQQRWEKSENGAKNYNLLLVLTA